LGEPGISPSAAAVKIADVLGAIVPGMRAVIRSPPYRPGY
jgi:hypothetical protein